MSGRGCRPRRLARLTPPEPRSTSSGRAPSCCWRRSPWRPRRACLHVAVDDNSRVVHAEMPPGERRATACGFMARALAFFEGLGVERVMPDNGPAYRSGDFNAMLGACGMYKRAET